MVRYRSLISLSVRRRRNFRSGSMTVNGSSISTAATSSRTKPRPSEINCFWSAVRRFALRSSRWVRLRVSATSSTFLAICSSAWFSSAACQRRSALHFIQSSARRHRSTGCRPRRCCRRSARRFDFFLTAGCRADI